MTTQTPLLIITGYGPGLGDAIAARFGAAGYRVIGVSRTSEPSNAAGDTTVVPIHCDLTDEVAARGAFAEIFDTHGAPHVLVHNVAKLVIAPFAQIDSATFTDAWRSMCLSAFHSASACLAEMEKDGGTLIFTGATASVRGGKNFAAFASAKFALRGLAQSLAREYGPKGIHVVHALIDGLIWGPQSVQRFQPDEAACLQPSAIADAYFHLAQQPRSTWTHELDLRPASESF